MDNLLPSRSVFLNERLDGLRLAAGDHLDHVVRPAHESVAVHLGDPFHVLDEERDLRFGDFMDPLLARDMLVANLSSEGLADDFGDLRRRQLDGPKQRVGLSGMSLRICQDRVNHCALIFD